MLTVDRRAVEESSPPQIDPQPKEVGGMQISVDDTFIVVDRGEVVFTSKSLTAAQTRLSINGRGVLCKVLCADIADFIQQKPKTQKTPRKVRVRDRI